GEVTLIPATSVGFRDLGTHRGTGCAIAWGAGARQSQTRACRHSHGGTCGGGVSPGLAGKPGPPSIGCAKGAASSRGEFCTKPYKVVLRGSNSNGRPCTP